MSTHIVSFMGEHEFLSNFYEQTVHFNGVAYPTAEHAFQAAKTVTPEEHALILAAATPGRAKRLGKKVKLRPDWESVKIDMMRQVLRSKFSHPDLQHLLLETGDAELIEGNDWGDRFWGVCDGRGNNWLGKLLMEVREEIRTSKK